MKFFLDTADIAEIKTGIAWGVVDGVTTNPSLYAKVGGSYEELLKEICGLTKGPVSAEVIDLIKTKPAGPEREAGIRKVLETNFDLAFMGRSALATYWDETNEQQRIRFLKAAVSAEAKAYSERFGQYGGQTLAVGKVIQRSGGVQVVLDGLAKGNIRFTWPLG